MQKNYNFKSGNATLKLNITGKLKDAAASLKFGLDNLSVSDKSMSAYNEKLTGDFLIRAKELSGKINNDNFKTLKRGCGTTCPLFLCKIIKISEIPEVRYIVSG